MRCKAYFTFLIPLLATLFVVGFIETAAADDDKYDNKRYSGGKYRSDAKAEIWELMSCYAYSFDAIARADGATDLPNPFEDPQSLAILSQINIDDPNFREGYKRFRSCTTRDFVIEIYDLDGEVVLPEGFIPAGPLSWVNLVNFFDRIGGVTNQQHHFGSLSTKVHGRKGTLTAYAIITTFSDDGEPTTGTSTYTSHVVYKRGKWLLKKVTFVEN